MLISQFESSAIDSIELVRDKSYDLTIIYKNSQKSYNYSINNKEFEKQLVLTILAEESLGKFINKSIKSGDIVVLNTGKV